MAIDEIKKQYPYLYETHMHTNQGSRCGKNSGEDMVRAYKEAGYTGVIVTDHNWGGNTAVDRTLPWAEWVRKFFEGYREAKRTGDEIGLQVFCGWEAGYHGPEFLIYGLDENWLIHHPELQNACVSEQYQIIHDNGGLVIQAHPYREETYIDQVRLYPDDVDGAEIVNATHSNSRSTSHNHPVFDERAIAYAREHQMMTTAGSDMHNVNLFGGGMAFQKRLDSIRDFADTIRNKEDYLLTDGENWYLRTGEKIDLS